ncbi:DUF362 domain-containing protein [Natranaerobius thermophilus]|uniref:Ferredoxin n=1 Tax=Natranaerobius thermophilus (strain ATCC BAA-1301 / DSM 18059 / JW/NM-WN-LF) TaxID=457570 RepID=B2A385_NATTJ|nr:4Fe-4S binding protein [Natranaerobius thermophilus]ACB85015.1 4Fe-4S ferredoxin iron-sulfur binding domain protein [Natranaerobius thermophilus JW/NM-WN-LF]
MIFIDVKGEEKGGGTVAFRITEECIACGSCLDACPVDAIKEGEEIFSITEDCTECGSCVDECPTDAIVEE